MPRTVGFDLAGEHYEMPLGFKASLAISERVRDPMAFLKDYVATQTFNLSSVEVVRVLHIGAVLAGCKMTEEEFGDKLLAGGVINYAHVAAAYVTQLVIGGPEQPVPEPKRTKKNAQ